MTATPVTTDDDDVLDLRTGARHQRADVQAVRQPGHRRWRRPTSAPCACSLTAPNAAFETAVLAKLNLAPKHVWEELLAGLQEGETAEAVLEESRIGSGPFKFVRWVTQQEVVLEANRPLGRARISTAGSSASCPMPRPASACSEAARSTS